MADAIYWGYIVAVAAVVFLAWGQIEEILKKRTDSKTGWMQRFVNRHPGVVSVPIIAALCVLSFMFFSGKYPGKTAVEKSYDKGFRDAADMYDSDKYDEGYNDGYSIGYNDGADYGRESAEKELSKKADDSYDDGFMYGEDRGYESGHDDGYSDGYSDGYDEGYYDGYNSGFGDTYNSGYHDGWWDGYASCEDEFLSGDRTIYD